MSQLRALAKDCAFTQEDEVVKFLLLHRGSVPPMDRIASTVAKVAIT